MTRKTEAESFTLDKDGHARFIVNCPAYSSVEFYYVYNVNADKFFGKPILNKSEKFSENEVVFLHFLSLIISETGIGFFFYYLWELGSEDSFRSCQTSNNNVGFEFDQHGFLHGIGVSDHQGPLFGKIIYSKSLFQLDPLPALLPDPPKAEDKPEIVIRRSIPSLSRFNTARYTHLIQLAPIV